MIVAEEMILRVDCALSAHPGRPSRIELPLNWFDNIMIALETLSGLYFDGRLWYAGASIHFVERTDIGIIP